MKVADGAGRGLQRRISCNLGELIEVEQSVEWYKGIGVDCDDVEESAFILVGCMKVWRGGLLACLLDYLLAAHRSPAIASGWIARSVDGGHLLVRDYFHNWLPCKL